MMTRMGPIVFVLLLSTCLYGVVIDGSVTSRTNANVETLVVDINGVTRHHNAREDLVVVSGDSLTIKDAILSDPKLRPTLVNVVGYVHPTSPTLTDDRKILINTAKDLMPAWSVDKQGVVYNVDIKIRRETVGTVRIHIIPPELKFFAVKVNGARQIFRPGQTAIFKASDRFKVEEIATNIENDQDSVEYELVEISSPTAAIKESKKQFKLKFFRQGIEFASVPILIENL